MRKFYGFYLPLLFAAASVVLSFNGPYFVQHPRMSYVILGTALVAPAVLLFWVRNTGRIARTLRLLGFRMLRARWLAIFGSVALALLLLGISIAQFLEIPLVSFVHTGFVIVTLVLIYLLALVRNGNFWMNEPTDFLFRCEQEPPVYLLQGKVARHVPDPPTLVLLGWTFDQVASLGRTEFRAFTIGRPLESVSDARLVQKESPHQEVWMVFEGEKRRVPDQRTLDYLRALKPMRTIDTLNDRQLEVWRDGDALRSAMIIS